jgi:4-amino-4-deoxy-L-arabinose transferase-like glycosyltransferase
MALWQYRATFKGTLTHRMFPSFFAPLNRLSPLVLAALLFILSFVAFSWRIGEGPIYRTMEGREALVMQEITHTGNWILPLRNGETIPSKPPLLHWCGVLAANFTGSVSPWSVRFPNALFSALSVALTCLLGCRLSGRAVGVLAALMLFTTPAVVEMAREGWVDPALSFFVLTALTSFTFMYENEEWRDWKIWLFYLSLAGAVLSKGPIGYILPFVVIVSYLALQQNLSRLRTLIFLPGIVIALGLPLLWYLLAFSQQGWLFVHKQIWQENLVRFTAGSGKRIPSATFFFLPFIVEGFPWSLLFCFGLWRLAQQAPVRERGVFPLVWLLSIVVFFAVAAGKRSIYLLPVYPAMVLFAADWGGPAVAQTSQPLPTWLRGGLRGLALLIAGLAIVGAVSAATGQLKIDTPWIDTLLGKDKWSNMALYIRFFAEHPVYGVFTFSLLCISLYLAVFAGTAGQWQRGLWFLMGALLLSTVAIYPFTRAYTKEFKSFTGFAAAISERVPAEAPLHFYTPLSYSSEFDEFSQVYFYLNRHVPLAPCAEQADLSRCEPGYYLLRYRHWQKIKDASPAEIVLDSRTSAGPDAEARLVLIRRVPY